MCTVYLDLVDLKTDFNESLNFDLVFPLITLSILGLCVLIRGVSKLNQKLLPIFTNHFLFVFV